MLLFDRKLRKLLKGMSQIFRKHYGIDVERALRTETDKMCIEKNKPFDRLSHGRTARSCFRELN